MSGAQSGAGHGLCPVNLWSEEFNDEFWPTIGRLQAEASLGVHTQGSTPCYFATRFQDVFAVLRDAGTFSSEQGVAILGGDNRAEPPKNEGRFLPEDLDPPVHTGWRKIIDPYLTVKRVAGYEDKIREVTDELLGGVLPGGRFPVMAGLLRPLQLKVVFSEILHLPGDEIDDWMHWSHDLFVGETPEIAGAAFVNINNAAADLVRARMADPLPDDLVSAVCVVRDINGREPTMAERTAVVVPLAIAGTESVGTVLGGIVHHLARHPDALAELAGDRSLVPAAVEEGLRMFANVTALQRTATVDTELAGVHLPAGAKVWTSYNGANRDPARFPDPHTWNLHREDVRHVAFSVGPHRCLGANHARLMMRTALDRLLERVPRFRLAPDQDIKTFSMPTRGIHEFSIEVG
ncbi:cytochrome P450 [Amycolatopsis acidicola]|uniref:Cytochrome P450 n=1 Tax=Amycolatopsis acidicola TaxID=2596893 RepID=A0A5N0UZ96_9PSEU|nr:cytochrome P450 [Amycolatopsis acidicola]KAA9156569.1 cytochrome P450 [Amycolatopsis acidicola]